MKRNSALGFLNMENSLEAGRKIKQFSLGKAASYFWKQFGSQAATGMVGWVRGKKEGRKEGRKETGKSSLAKGHDTQTAT